MFKNSKEVIRFAGAKQIVNFGLMAYDLFGNWIHLPTVAQDFTEKVPNDSFDFDFPGYGC